MLGFPDSSVGKESACNAGDPALIPGLGSSTGEGKGYLPISVFWPREIHGLYSPLGCKESDTTALTLSLSPRLSPLVTITLCFFFVSESISVL